MQNKMILLPLTDECND